MVAMFWIDPRWGAGSRHATISWSVERLLEGFDMSRRPLLFCRGAILLAACRAAPSFNSPCRRSQTLRRDAALASRPKEQATRPRVLLWVHSGNSSAGYRTLSAHGYVIVET